MHWERRHRNKTPVKPKVVLKCREDINKSVEGVSYIHFIHKLGNLNKIRFCSM